MHICGLVEKFSDPAEEFSDLAEHLFQHGDSLSISAHSDAPNRPVPTLTICEEAHEGRYKHNRRDRNDQDSVLPPRHKFF